MTDSEQWVVDDTVFRKGDRVSLTVSFNGILRTLEGTLLLIDEEGHEAYVETRLGAVAGDVEGLVRLEVEANHG